MALKPQSIRNNVDIFIHNKLATKEEIFEISKEWSSFQEDFFKKMLKQGGRFKIANVPFKVVPQEKLLNSKGEKEGKVAKSPSVEDRV